MEAAAARSKFRDVLDSVLRGEHVSITRWHRRVAVVVPADWYDQAIRRLAEPEGDSQDADA